VDTERALTVTVVCYQSDASLDRHPAQCSPISSIGEFESSRGPKNSELGSLGNDVLQLGYCLALLWKSGANLPEHV